MGYTLVIGNAEPQFDSQSFPELYARWKCVMTSHPDAPMFPGDEMTGRGNTRSPSYTVWADFARATGIYDLLFDDGTLRGGHPGCYGLTREDSERITAALGEYQAKATLPPGFEGWRYDGPPRYDYHLARLIWLDWWVRWAVENCETPAISNT